MSEPAPDAPAESTAFDRVLADYLRRLDRGEGGDRQRLLAEHPELADELRAFFDADDEVGCFAGSTLDWAAEGVSGAVEDAADGGPRPDRLGDYELLRELGRGGMGAVYLARQAGLNRLVCVKVLLSGARADEAEVHRFRREAEAAAGLKHPGIVAIYDVGRWGGQHYFAMEYVEGRTLAELARAAPLPADRAARYVRDVAAAVDFAHRRGVLHRDLKPSNILIDADDRPRVTDFGLARPLGAEGGLTQTGAIVGTPAYMPPEQAAGAQGALGPQSDVYALGAVLYELMTGRPPFRGETPLETLLQARKDDPVRPGLLNPKVPADLETIGLKCLEKDPQRRYATAQDLADELGRFLERRPIRARPIGAGRRAVRWCRRNPALAALIASALSASLVSAAFAVETYRAYQAARGAVASKDEALLEVARQRDLARGHLYVARFQRAWQAWRASDLAGLDGLLEALRPSPGEADRRGWEWSFLRAVAHQERQSLDARAGPVRSVAWDRTGTRLAAGGEDGVVRLWDLRGGAILARLGGPAGAVHAVAWSPDGTRLATAGEDGSVRVWDAALGRLLHSRRIGAGAARSVAWDGAGRRLAVAGDAGVAIWDAELARPEVVLRDLPAPATAVAWGPGGSRLATGGDDGAIRVWDATTGEPVARMGGRHAGWVNAVAWDRDGRQLASVGQDGTLKLWDAEAGRERLSRGVPRGAALLALAWSPDGRHLATAGADRVLTIWDAAGQAARTWRGHRAAVRALAWGPEGDVASAGEDGTVKLWRALAPDDGSLVRDDPAPVKSVAWSPDGSALASVDLDGTIRVWEPDAGREVRSWEEPLGRARAVAWDGAGRRLAASRGEAVLILDLEPGREPMALGGHEGPVWCAAWDPTGRRLASGGNDGEIRIWDGRSGRPEGRWPGPGGALRLLAWDGAGRRLAAAGTGSAVQIWDAPAGRPLLTLAGLPTPPNALAWDGAGRRLAAAMGDGTVHVGDAETGRTWPSLRGHVGPVASVAWSSDGRRLATSGHDGTVRIWDAGTHQELLVLRGHQGPVWCVAWSRDGRRLASAGVDQTTRIWDAEASPAEGR